MSGAGGAAEVNNRPPTLDDAATLPPPDEGSSTVGRIEPSNEVAVVDPFPVPAPGPSGSPEPFGLDGMNSKSPWQLWVVDDVHAEDGQLVDTWSVTITAGVLRWCCQGRGTGL